jgi:hypothetical protein
MTLPPQIITILIAVPATLLTISLRKSHFIKLYYRLKPQSKVLKARIRMLAVGDQINYLYFCKGSAREKGSIKISIDKVNKNTIRISYINISKRYISLLPNGELIVLDFTDY